MPIITDIAPQKRRPDRFSVFVDGDFAFGLHGDEVTRYGIAVGNTVTEKQLIYLKNEVVFVKARDTALRYIAYRARSYIETRKRLEKDDYPPDVIERVMALMLKYHYVDDAQFARDYAVSRLRNGKLGLRRIAQELRVKGVETSLIEETISALRQTEEEDGGEARAAKEWLVRKRLDLRDPIKRKRGVEALLRRGFNYATIKEAIAIIERELIESELVERELIERELVESELIESELIERELIERESEGELDE